MEVASALYFVVPLVSLSSESRTEFRVDAFEPLRLRKPGNDFTPVDGASFGKPSTEEISSPRRSNGNQETPRATGFDHEDATGITIAAENDVDGNASAERGDRWTVAWEGLGASVDTVNRRGVGRSALERCAATPWSGKEWRWRDTPTQIISRGDRHSSATAASIVILNCGRFSS